jgi:hypothetical protein
MQIHAIMKMLAVSGRICTGSLASPADKDATSQVMNAD